MDFCYRRNRKIEDTKKADKAFDRVYAEKGDDGAALQELLGYVRAGDTVTIEDARELGESATEFIELALALYRKRAVLICKTPKIDTAAGYWQMVLAEITKLTAGNNGNDDGRPSRFVEDLYKCFDLVECRKMTVDEACDKMGIGRTTYYRYWRKVKSAPQRERHTELFEELQVKIEANELSISAACRQMNIGAGTYYKMRDQYEREKLGD